MDTSRYLEDLFGEKPYEALVKGIRDFGIIHLDLEANVLSWNKGAERIFGFDAAEIIGRNFAIIFTAEDQAAGIPEKELAKAAATDRAEDVRWHDRKDGSRVFANGVTTALRSESGELLGFAKICRDDTERKLMEDALAAANARSRVILESLTDAFFALDKDWRFTYLNKQCEPLLRRSAAELLGKEIWAEFPEAVGSAFHEQYLKVVAEQAPVTFEEYYGPLDSWFEVRAYPASDGGLSVYFHNIDERAERRSLESLNSNIGNALVQNTSLRELLNLCVQHLVEDLDVAFARIWTLNDDENVLELQASAGMYTHVDGDHSRVPVGKFKIGMIAKERRPHITNTVPTDTRISDRDWAIREGMKAFAGYPLIVEDNLVGVMAVFAKRRLHEGTLSAMASVADGIANAIRRKKIESALQQSEEQYRLVAETANDAIITIDEKSTILFVNRAASRIFGYGQDEMIGNNLTSLMPEYLRNLHLAGQQRYLATGRKHLHWDHVEVPGLHQAGHVFPIELSFGEYKKDGKHIFIGIARDISQRRMVEDALRESEQKFSTLAETVPQLVWMAEPDGSIFWYNGNWYDYTGTTPEEMEGWGWQKVHDPEILPSVVERWKASIETGESFEMEFPLRGRDGVFRWFLTRVNPARDEEGRIIRWFGTNTDIDVQRRLDQRNRFIIEIDEAVRGLESPKDITLTLARLLGEHLGADRCAYAEVEADEDHVNIPGDYAREGVDSVVGHYALSQFGSEVVRLMHANEPYVVNDVSTDARLSAEDLAAYKLIGVKALICVPLHKNGRFAACMAVHQQVPRGWKSEEVELVAFVANRFWESIERARIVNSLHESLSREQQARQAAESANKIKDEFLATISHELRTPLNAILGWTSLLRSRVMPAEASERAIETVERNARAQAQLIDDLLDISRIISGKLRLEVTEIHLERLIHAAAETVRPAAEAKGIRLQTLIDPDAGPVSGDPGRLQQVFWNLLSNSVKFTPKNGRVQIRLERVNSHVEISVTDTGNGIAPEFIPYVFDRFRQADQATTRLQGGLGLGLSIVRQIVEMHGGTVRVESEGEGKGSTFTVLLPRLAAIPRHREVTDEREHPRVSKDDFVSIDCAPVLDGLRVLVVDDEADARELLREVLEVCGSDVVITGTASEALETLRNGKFDVLVSDIGMPNEDGYTLIEKVRSLTDAEGGRTPAIALTAYARVEDRIRALKAGFQAHLPKPVEPVELAAVVASLANGNWKV